MKSIHDIFESQSRISPDNIALIHDQQKITYQSLNNRANAVANTLKEQGLQTGEPVAIFLQRSPETIIAMLGILKAGGVYVPIDRSSPNERVSIILKDCNPRTILTTRADCSHLPKTSLPSIFLEESHYSKEKIEKGSWQEISPEDPAYIIYTSGTTGTPKGVIVPHQGVIRLVFNQTYIDFGPEKNFLQLSTIAFDAATLEIWGPLLHGGKCVLYPNNSIPDPTVLEQLIVQENISTAWLTASLFNMLINTKPDCLINLSEILTGGEALSPHHIHKALKYLPKTKLINGYGPTENTTFTSCYKIPQSLSTECTSIPIGKPLNKTTIHILDQKLQPVSPGEEGELFTGGDGLALGYLNRIELTSEKFIHNPNSDAPDRLWFKTGDIVRQLQDGNLDYVGRIDDQVKIRGFRIELGEICSTLISHPQIADAVITMYIDEHQSKHIIAYFIPQGSQLSNNQLRDYLAKKLPGYMIPSCFMQIASIPLNQNGKLDKVRLPKPSFSTYKSQIKASTGMEKKLAAIWCSLLNIEVIGITDNFFDIGGSSLLGVELITAINNHLEIDRKLESVALYQFPTIQALANHLAPPGPVTPLASNQQSRAKRQKKSFNKFKKNKQLS